MKRYYQNEEEFITEFGLTGAVDAATKAVRPDIWNPNEDCNDAARQQRDYFLNSGELSQLTFNGAATNQNEDGSLSLQIILVTAKRSITVKVDRIDGKWTGKKIVDQPYKNT